MGIDLRLIGALTALRKIAEGGNADGLQGEQDSSGETPAQEESTLVRKNDKPTPLIKSPEGTEPTEESRDMAEKTATLLGSLLDNSIALLRKQANKKD